MDVADLPDVHLSVRTVLAGPLAPGALTLDAAASHHLLRVLRVARGGAVRVVDGAGNEALAVLDAVVESRATLLVGPVRAEPAKPACVVLLGAPRPALLEEALTLGTEVGASAFWMVRAARSLPAEPRLDRLERVIDAALRQCRRADRPILRWFASLPIALAAHPPGARFVAAPGAAPAHDAWRGGPASDTRSGITLAIGPEGGWHPDEVELLLAADFVPVGLGASILRAPTAVAVGIAALDATR